MPIKFVFWDLDGTLLPMNQELFIKTYFDRLVKRLATHGYDPELLRKAIWSGTAAMMKNNGEKRNEAIFWEKLTEIYGEKIRNDFPLFETFYKTEFDGIREVCGYNPQAAETVQNLQRMNLRMVLATNPLFPAIATEKRIGWAGLAPQDFEFYTTYENSRYSKPNLNYYRDLLEQLNAKAEECLMVGNDVDDDMAAKKIGMQVFLLTDCLINAKNEDITVYPRGGFSELLAFIREKQSVPYADKQKEGFKKHFFSNPFDF